jgi:pyruvate kinase
VKAFLKQQNLVKENDLLIHIASIPMKERGRANMIKLGIV